MKTTSALSIRYKIAAALLAVLTLALGLFAVLSFQLQKDALEVEMRMRGRGVARQLASDAKTALLTKDELGGAAAIGEARRAGALYAVILDRKGAVFAQQGVEDPDDRFTRDAQEITFRSLDDFEGPILDVAAPVLARYGEKTLRAGSIRLGLSRTPLIEAIRQQKQLFMVIALIFALASLVMSFALGGMLTRRLVALTRVMSAAARGDLEQSVAVDGRDEIAVLSEAFNDMLRGLREKLQLEKYVPSSAVQLIHDRPGERLKLGGERRRVSVLFSDIRGFTALTETLEPERLVRTLNVYLNLQAEVVRQRGGVVDKFVGDAVMALFTGEDAEFRAALVAQEILNFVSSLNESRDRAGKLTMRVGVGLNAGEVIAANIGSERQMSYTAIGDPINCAARLCAAALPGQALLSRAVVDAAGDRCRVAALGRLTLKGKAEPVDVWELLDVPHSRCHFRRAVELRATCRPVAGEPVPVKISDMGRGGCRIETPVPLDEGAAVELDIVEEVLGAINARAAVRHAHARDGRFTAGLAFVGLEPSRLDALTEWAHEV